MIKSKLSLYGIEYRRSHDISYLLDLLPRGKLPNDHTRDAVTLTMYAVDARYDPITPTVEQMERAFAIAESIVSDL